MEKFEEILDKALLELKQGTSKDAVLLKWPEHRQALEPLLAVTEQFSNLPKNPVPEPAMQRKYLQVPIKTHAWFAWVHVSRLVSVSAAAFLLIAGSAATVYGAARSLPGQTLFPLRKTAEQIQLHFASNDIERANIQLKITQERLADAQEVFSSPHSNTSQQVAALNELNSQTGTALQTVKSVATNNQGGSPLAASLKTISTQQQVLLNTITASDKTASTTATQPQAVAMLRAAAADEQKVLISLNQTTAIASSTPEVKGAATGTSTLPSLLVDQTSSTSSTSSAPSHIEKDIPLPQPSQAIGTFIPESPAPQFQP